MVPVPPSDGQADVLARRVQALRRPSRKLLWLYLLRSLGGLFLQPLVFLPLYFKYHTLTYRFDAKGVRASWGILFRREVYVAYGRIQDIHLTRGLVERWLGLGTVEVQTASGSAGAELSIVGLEEHEDVRDFLYLRMRGLKDAHAQEEGGGRSEAVAVLQDIRADLAEVRRALAARGGGRG